MGVGDSIKDLKYIFARSARKLEMSMYICSKFVEGEGKDIDQITPPLGIDLSINPVDTVDGEASSN